MLDLYAIADGKVSSGPGDPTVIICLDEFAPLKLQPHSGKQWAPQATGRGEQDRPRRRRRRATYKRPHGVRHLPAGWDLSSDRLYGHVRAGRDAPSSGVLPLPALPVSARCADRDRAEQLRPAPVHQDHRRVGDWAAANGVELAHVPFYGSGLNRIEAQFTALRYFALDGTDHESHREQPA